ncbi:PREDICTED: uncharacterized protein LOC109193805 isoform X2 [Ipomoea nil]|uniref:uncharacterized protein LOC109193805 isoform X2 n=1 Tax=Ipomoea nil TaxID=35883 RepID=UPI000901CA73|nr:PREDICTED: uncharacterized protein LOC109193805 isoform X2 [Ipomoea nil]
MSAQISNVHLTAPMLPESIAPMTDEESRRSDSISDQSDDDSVATCRVCQCAESDKRGDTSLGFLGIIPPSGDAQVRNWEIRTNHSEEKDGDYCASTDLKGSKLVEFVSPRGEVFVCNADVEMGSDHNQDTLIELGCACKNDLALVHYACALKWFVNHGSTTCEICGCIAKHIRISDIKKVISSLKEYSLLRERTANGEHIPSQLPEYSSVDPDAVATIQRQRLSEISLWFNPHNNTTAPSQVVSEQPSIVAEEVFPAENTATNWALEGTGVLLATGLLTVTLAWLIAPRVGKKTAKTGLHILLGGVCALTVVVFFRFFVLTRIRYGPARYWAILFVFWFLVFGIWASRTHDAHSA